MRIALRFLNQIKFVKQPSQLVPLFNFFWVKLKKYTVITDHLKLLYIFIFIFI